LDDIYEENKDWKKKKLMNVFKEKIIKGEREEEKSSGVNDVGREGDVRIMEKKMGEMVDIKKYKVFEEKL
jgi:hypothetical protein